MLFKVLYSCEVAFLIGFTPDTDDLMALGGLVLDCRVLAHTARPAVSDRDSSLLTTYQVRINFIMVMILVDRPCAMGG